MLLSARLGIEPACLAGSEVVTIDRARIFLWVRLGERRYLPAHGAVERVEVAMFAQLGDLLALSYFGHMAQLSILRFYARHTYLSLMPYSPATIFV